MEIDKTTTSCKCQQYKSVHFVSDQYIPGKVLHLYVTMEQYLDFVLGNVIRHLR